WPGNQRPVRVDLVRNSNWQQDQGDQNDREGHNRSEGSRLSRRPCGPFPETQSEGKYWNKPAVGILFIGGPLVAELPDQIGPQESKRGSNQPNGPTTG